MENLKRSKMIRQAYNPERFNPSPLFAQQLLNGSGMSLATLSIGLGVTDRTVSYWKSKGFPRYIEQYGAEQFISEATAL